MENHDHKSYVIEPTRHAPFSPMLMEYDIPKPYLNMLNNYGDEISANDEKSKQLDWSENLVGNVKQEHKIEEHILYGRPDTNLPRFFDWIGQCTNLYMKTMHSCRIPPDKESAEKGIDKVMMHNIWLVNSIAGDFNPPHMHFGMLSAAGWLKVPESVEKNEEREKAGWIEFLYGNPNIFVDWKYTVKPHVGQLFLFPAWMIHQVFPFRGNGLRRTISFNISFEVPSDE
jgi:hypothetical protein